jgi:uncharacterized protein YjbI with pentapeptide repeats
VVIGITFNTWAEGKRENHTREREIRLRLVGDDIQTSEVVSLINSQRRRKWPLPWKKKQPDLSRANLAGVDLRGQDLSGIKFFRANLRGAD